MLDMIKHNKLVVAAIVVVLVGVACYALSGHTSSSSSALTTEDATGTQSAQEREALDILLQLRSIQLNGTIFSDAAFQSLKDFRTEIVSEPVGRRNPFAPLSSSEQAATTTVQGAR